jgi:hypothetical protein
MQLISIVIASLGVMLCVSVSKVRAQSGAPGNSDKPYQWVSHQMNQPPPDLRKGRTRSPESVDDIRRLYELAKKEAEARMKLHAGPSK